MLPGNNGPIISSERDIVARVYRTINNAGPTTHTHTQALVNSAGPAMPAEANQPTISFPVMACRFHSQNTLLRALPNSQNQRPQFQKWDFHYANDLLQSLQRVRAHTTTLIHSPWVSGWPGSGTI